VFAEAKSALLAGVTCFGDLSQLDCDATAYDRRRALQARQCDVVFCIEEPVNLCAACLEQRRHLVFRDLLFPHGLRELPERSIGGKAMVLIPYDAEGPRP
jgi:hypothetical protein